MLAGVRRERRLPQGQREPAPRRGVLGDRGYFEPGQPVGGLLGLGDGGRGEHEGRRRAVQGADPPQPAYDGRDVRTEHAAVVVTFVDHDVAQAAEELRPPGVPGQQRAVQHVGVGEEILTVVARPLPQLARRVAVVGGGAHVESEREQVGELVLGECLGGGDIEDRAAALAAFAAARPDRGQPRQQERQRLPGRRAGRDHDVPAGVGQVGGGRLVRPRQHHATSGERRADLGRDPPRPRREDRLARGSDLQVGEPLATRGYGDQPVDHLVHGRRSRSPFVLHPGSLANAPDNPSARSNRCVV